jgi:aerotolerance regulator-like protein/VWA domain-containing protein/CARDB protein
VSFLSSLFLWALPLAAVPIVIHLLHRRRRQVIRWGAMQLLLEAAPTKRRVWQINDLLLMLLRTLAVAAVILAFSLPQVRSGLLGGKTPGRDTIFIVDSSLSTGRLVNGAPVFDAIRNKTHELLAGLDDSDQVRLILAANRPEWLVRNLTAAPSSRQEIFERISSLKSTLSTADMPACLQAALGSELPAGATSRLIVVITDGVEHGWSADSRSFWQGIREAASRSAVPTTVNVVIAGSSKSPFANLSVDKLGMTRSHLGAGELFSVTARIRNTGDVPRDATVLKWDLDGRPCGESQVSALSPGESHDVVFETSCDQPGVFLLSGRLGTTDDLSGDNSASIAVDALDRLPILVCRSEADLERPASQPDFLKAALGRGPEASHDAGQASVFDPTLIGIDALGATDLARYRCVVLDDVLPPSAEVADRLSDFAAKGGGVWLMLGANITADQFNSILFRDGFGFVPLKLGLRLAAANDRDKFFTIHAPEGTNLATVLLGDTERLDIDDVRISQRWQLLVPEAADDLSVLLETGDGAPLAVEHFTGKGRIIVQGVPNVTSWSNLPLCQAYVPLVQEWIWYLTDPTATKYNLRPGQPIVPSWPEGGDVKQVQVRTPLEAETTVPNTTVQIEKSQTSTDFRETAFPGNYVVRTVLADARTREIPFTVERDPDESRLVPLSKEQIGAISEQGGLRFVADGLAVPEGAAKPVVYRPLSNYFVILLAGLFLAELIGMHVLTRRRI